MFPSRSQLACQAQVDDVGLAGDLAAWPFIWQAKTNRNVQLTSEMAKSGRCIALK